MWLGSVAKIGGQTEANGVHFAIRKEFKKKINNGLDLSILPNLFKKILLWSNYSWFKSTSDGSFADRLRIPNNWQGTGQLTCVVQEGEVREGGEKAPGEPQGKGGRGELLRLHVRLLWAGRGPLQRSAVHHGVKISCGHREPGALIHCKKRLAVSRPQPGCHCPNSPWAGII